MLDISETAEQIRGCNVIAKFERWVYRQKMA